MATATPDLDTLNEQQLRDLARQLLARVDEKQTQIARRERLINLKDTTIAQLTHEIAVLRRFRFGKKSEQLSGVQGSLLEEAVAADIAAIEEELEQLTDHPRKATPTQQPKRQALPAELPRIEIHHEPHSTISACSCQLERIREDVAE